MTLRKLFAAIAVFTWIAALATGEAARAMEFPATPPTFTIYSKDFQGVQGIPASWQVALGTWQADGQTYNSTAAAPTAVTTIFEYPFPEPDGSTFIFDHVPSDEYTFAARLRNQRGDASALVGLVYSYIDPSNYFEVAFSPGGIAYVRRMFRGQMETLAAATYTGAGQGMWFSAAVKVAHEGVSITVNGVLVYDRVMQFEGDAGQVGFSTYNTTAKFNKVALTMPFGQQPFTEDFSDGVADGFSSPQGTFAVSNGEFIDTAVHQTGMAFAPIGFGVGSQIIIGYTVHVRMLNPYGAAGNLVGIMFDTSFPGDPPAYQEVVFSPTGVAQIRRVSGGTIQVLKSAPHTVGPNKWFDVTFAIEPGLSLTVNVNGEPVFTREPIGLMTSKPEVLALITHWTPARFDDFRFDLDPPIPATLQTFDSPLGAGEVQTGTWDTQGGTLNDVSAGIADIVLPGRILAKTDYRYKGRLVNQYANSGNLVGLVFSYGSAKDYLEAVFSPTGQAYLNLTMEGTRYRLATGTHTVPRNVAFDVEILRKGSTATVTVNGKPTFQNVQVGQLDGGFLGVVSHWSKSHTDNLATKEAP
jgi:hypothetical protein